MNVGFVTWSTALFWLAFELGRIWEARRTRKERGVMAYNWTCKHDRCPVKIEGTTYETVMSVAETHMRHSHPED